ncbi:hypothetical protein [Rhodococcus erythropolis]|uniref:hypothetical protein n=1 Tax=Rhodococcus erythropolis TaxID=1833 RepID=UPI003211D13F
MIVAAIEQILDGELLTAIFATSGALDPVAMRRTEDSAKRLLDPAPAKATHVTKTGAEEQVLQQLWRSATSSSSGPASESVRTGSPWVV